jgi:serine/threonine protein kinase
MSGNDGAYLKTGQILVEKYRIERVLGGGGMGVVALATHVHLEQRVALKFLKPEHVARPELMQRFAQEARAAARIRGEHVARVTDVEALPDGTPFMVMEYLEGEDLAERMQRKGRLPYLEAAGFILEACEAIAEAHALRVVHRDLKPSNLFLARQPDGSEIIKVLDFGISKMLDDEVGLTKTQASFGSIPYMAPEQMRNAKYCDERTDIWALGVTLYELVTQSYPFHGSTGPEVVAAVMEGSLISLASIDPHAPPGVVRVIHRCMQRDPSQRYIDIAELAGDLASLVATPEAVTSAKRIARVLGVDAAQLNVGSLDVQRMHSSGALMPSAAPNAAPVPVPGAFSQTPAGAPGRPSGYPAPHPAHGFPGAPGTQPIQGAPGAFGEPGYAAQDHGDVAPYSQRGPVSQGAPASMAPAPPSQAAPASGPHGGRLSQTSPEALAMASTTPPPARGRFLLVGLLGGGLAVASLVVLLIMSRGKGANPSPSVGSSPPPEGAAAVVSAATTVAIAPPASSASATPAPEGSVATAPANEAPKNALPTGKGGASAAGKKPGSSAPAASTGQVANVEPNPTAEPPAPATPASPAPPGAPAPKSTRPNPNSMTFKK